MLLWAQRETPKILVRSLFLGFIGWNLCFAPQIAVVFVMSVVAVISASSAINPFLSGCLSCLRHFRDSCRFREKHRIAKHRFDKLSQRMTEKGG